MLPLDRFSGLWTRLELLGGFCDDRGTCERIERSGRGVVGEGSSLLGGDEVPRNDRLLAAGLPVLGLRGSTWGCRFRTIRPVLTPELGRFVVDGLDVRFVVDGVDERALGCLVV
jgi:hypothetical protein